jgi:hypothetical protein
VRFQQNRVESCSFQPRMQPNAFQHCLTRSQLSDPHFEILPRNRANLQAEAAQDHANAQFHIDEPPK